MLDRLERMKERFQEVGQLMVQPDAMADMKNLPNLVRNMLIWKKLWRYMMLTLKF